MVDATQQRPLYIFTDSQLLISSLTKWIFAWQKNGFKNGSVKNVDLIIALWQAKGARSIFWQHVKAHTGKVLLIYYITLHVNCFFCN